MNVGRRSEKLAREEGLEDVPFRIFGDRVENGAVNDPERGADVSVGRALKVRHGLLEALAHLRRLPFQCGLKGDGIGRPGEPDVLLRHRGLFAVAPEGVLDALDLEPEHLPHVLFAHAGRDLLAHELIVRGCADGLRACGEGAKHEDGGKNLLHESSGKGQGEL